jgi:hypothetical protein
MSRAWIIAVALLFTGGSVAHAQGHSQGGLLGLPLVIKEGGWARYEGMSSEGPTQFVFKVGGPGRHGGKSGRWILLEIDVPVTGRLSIQFLVAGERFIPSNVLLLRVVAPGQPPQESTDAFSSDGFAGQKPRVVRQGTKTIAGRKLQITEYAFPEGFTAEWSPSVPGVGLTRVTGEQSFHLVAFGVGGDPWKGAAQAPAWPEPPARK